MENDPRMRVMDAPEANLAQYDGLYRKPGNETGRPWQFCPRAKFVLNLRKARGHGPRDMGSLEAFVFHPEARIIGDIVADVAAFLESMLIKHSFLDGNKRGSARVLRRLSAYQRPQVERRSGLDVSAHAEMAGIRHGRFEHIARDLPSVVPTENA